MSNDEYKTSLVNYNSRFYFDPSTINRNSNNNNNSNNLYQVVFPGKLCEKYSIASITTCPSHTQQKAPQQRDDINYNKTNSNSISHNTDKPVTDTQFVPMNLITNTGLDLSHSIRNPTFATYFNNDSLNRNKSNPYASSPCSSASPSIDVENDDNDDSGARSMSPVSIPSHHQNPLLSDNRNPSHQSAFTNMEMTAGAIPSGFPLSYHQYANNAALYGAPVMFSGAIHAAHASYMAGLPLHAALSPNETYLKAIQAAACGMYSPSALAPPPPPPPPLPPSTSSSASLNPSLITGKLSSLRSPTVSPMMALAPSSQSVGGISKTSQHQQRQYSPNVVNGVAEVEQQQQQQPQQQKKRDYHASSLNSQTPLRTTSGTSNSSGTYLNDKVNERLKGVDAAKDSHFKVPNGKEGSLKHRILRPTCNSDGNTEQNKTPVMRSYSTTSNFKKGNYIELSNGALRRVEDMRTEDFIQCAERSPHHQLAESTVVKINTSLPTTAVITFSYDRNRSKVDMEVSLDHPFFVYGQGWASCNPEMSMKMFGLKCQRLQVGDICISLTKREQPRQQICHAAQNNTQLNDNVSYQAKHLAVSSANATHFSKSSSLPTTEMSYSAGLNTHSFSIPVAQANHHLQRQQQQHNHQVHQQAYAEMAKLMSSYAYANGLSQVPNEQVKAINVDAAALQNLPPKVISAFYQNHMFQFAQQQQQQKDLRQSTEQQRISNHNYSVISSLNSTLSPPASDLENNHIQQQQQPPQTQPLDVTMSRKRRWSAPENSFDDDESVTQPPRNGSSPATART